MKGTDLERAKTISGAVNYIIAREKNEDKDTFIKEALMLHQALSLCSSLIDEPLRYEAAFFESVRVLLMRLDNQGAGKKISLPEINARINELLKHSIKSEGVINLFSDVKQKTSGNSMLYRTLSFRPTRFTQSFITSLSIFSTSSVFSCAKICISSSRSLSMKIFIFTVFPPFTNMIPRKISLCNAFWVSGIFYNVNGKKGGLISTALTFYIFTYFPHKKQGTFP